METRRDAAYAWIPLDFTGSDRITDLPHGAVVGGHEYGRPTYVARIAHGPCYELGKLNAWGRFGYGRLGTEYEVARGEILIAVGNHMPVWINGAFGEHVEGAVSCPGPEGGSQTVGRAWHKGRWVPGKIVHCCHAMFFSFGGIELSVRKYQLLSTDFVWQPHVDGMAAPEAAVKVDPSYGEEDRTTSNLVSTNPKSQLISGSANFAVLVQQRSGLQEAKWVVSADGEHIRGSIVSSSGAQIARVWADDRRGGGNWALGIVSPEAHQQPAAGVWIDRKRYSDYQVLVSSPKQEASRLLSLHISLGAAQSLIAADISPSEDIFMVTQLRSGERPWSAVRELVAEVDGGQTMSDAVRDHLRPMMPVVDHLARSETSQSKTLDEKTSYKQGSDPTTTDPKRERVGQEWETSSSDPLSDPLWAARLPDFCDSPFQ